MAQFNAHFSSVAGTIPSTRGEVIPAAQGGLLAAWTFQAQDFGIPSLQVEARIEHISDSGQNEYTLPIPVQASSFGDLDTFPPDSTLVLGENGVAFANFGGKVVSFDVASGAVHWTWQPDDGFAVMVAAAAGNGVVAAAFFNDGTHHIARLDSNGQATFDAWTWPGFRIQYAFGDTWLALGSTEAISAPGLLWPNSSFPEPTVAVAGEAYRHFDFELFFCAANLCSPHLDVAFIYRQDNPPPPLGETNPTTTLTPGQQTTIRAEAFKSLKAAFAGYPVKVGVAGPSKNKVKVTGDVPQLQNGSVPCGETALFLPSQPVSSLDFYLTNMEQAQFALGVQIAGPTPDNQTIFDNLVHAIGRGIGNVAVHEIGHQLGLPDSENLTGVYDGGSCDGEKDPASFTGVSADGTPIHWSDAAAQAIKNKIFAP